MPSGALLRIMTISIHAPTRGATLSIPIMPAMVSFQSTLLQEERPDIWMAWLSLRIFQSTLLQEERPSVCIPLNDAIRFISIHAPTRGATIYGYTWHNRRGDFNPRSYKRSDGKNAQLSLYLSVIIIA